MNLGGFLASQCQMGLDEKRKKRLSDCGAMEMVWKFNKNCEFILKQGEDEVDSNLMKHEENLWSWVRHEIVE